MDLENFINTLPFVDHAPGVKLSGQLEVLPTEALLNLVGIAPQEKVAMHGKAHEGEFLEEFEGSPLYAQAISLAEQELEMDKRHLQARLSRRMARQDNGWEEESAERDMFDIQKSQLMLELHKSRAGEAAATGAVPVVPPEAAAAGGPAAMPAGIPPEAPPEAAAAALAEPTAAPAKVAGVSLTAQDASRAQTSFDEASPEERKRLLGLSGVSAHGRRGAFRGGLLGAGAGFLAGGGLNYATGGKLRGLMLAGSALGAGAGSLTGLLAGRAGGAIAQRKAVVDGGALTPKALLHVHDRLGAAQAADDVREKAAAEKTALIGPALDLNSLGIPSGIGYAIGRGERPLSKEEAQKQVAEKYNVGAGLLIPGYTGYHYGRKSRGKKSLKEFEGGDQAGQEKTALSLSSIHPAIRTTAIMGGLGAVGGAATGALAAQKGQRGKGALRGGLVGGAIGTLGGGIASAMPYDRNSMADIGVLAGAAGAVPLAAAAARPKAKEREKSSAFSDAKQEKGLGKAMRGLSKKKGMDPDQKAGLAKGLMKNLKKEQAEGDPVKLSGLRRFLEG